MDQRKAQARRLVELREREELTQQGMADRLGVHIATYQQWEYGRRLMNAATVRLIGVLFPERKWKK